MDTNHDHRLKPHELRDGLRRYRVHLSDAEFEGLVKEVDRNNDGSVDFDEVRECQLRVYLRSFDHVIEFVFSYILI